MSELDLIELEEIRVISKRMCDVVESMSQKDAFSLLDYTVSTEKIRTSSIRVMLNISVSNMVNSIIDNNARDLSQSKDTVTYVLVNSITGLYKIGKTKKDIKERVAQLSGCNGGNNYVRLIFSGDIENELHKTFSDSRLNGEWFSLSSDDIECIKEKYNHLIT